MLLIMAMSSESASVNLRVGLKVVCRHWNWYGWSDQGQIFFSSRLVQLGAIYAHLMRVLIAGLKSGRLAV